MSLKKLAEIGHARMAAAAIVTRGGRLMEPEKFSEWRWVPIEEYAAGGPYSQMNPAVHAMVSEFLRRRAL